MTQGEWQESSDPHSMLESLRETASPRELRLFGLACSRRIEHLLAEGPIRELVGMIERCAEGSLSERNLYWAAWERHDASHSVEVDGEAASAVLAAAGLPPDWVIGQLPNLHDLLPVVREDIVEPRLVSAVQLAAVHSAAALAYEADPSGIEAAQDAGSGGMDGADWAQRAHSIARQMTTDARWAVALCAAEKEQAAWLRELFGNSFRPADHESNVGLGEYLP